MYAIKLENISKKYNKNGEIIEVLKKLNATFSNGKFYAIVGESGTGKTTLLKAISLLCSIDEGIITINNKNISLLNDTELSEMRMNEIGIIFQESNLLPYLTSIENIMLPLMLDSNNSNFQEMEKKAYDMLKYVGLENREKHYNNELSGGEQQRVAIARALINNPKIILADEPTGSLDKKNKGKILELFKEISSEEKCVIVVTHDKDVLKYADVIYSLQDGNLVIS